MEENRSGEESDPPRNERAIASVSLLCVALGLLVALVARPADLGAVPLDLFGVVTVAFGLVLLFVVTTTVAVDAL